MPTRALLYISLVTAGRSNLPRSATQVNMIFFTIMHRSMKISLDTSSFREYISFLNCLRNELICDHHDMIVIAVNIHFFILAIEIMHYKFDTEALGKLHINAVKHGILNQ